MVKSWNGWWIKSGKVFISTAGWYPGKLALCAACESPDILIVFVQ